MMNASRYCFLGASRNCAPYIEKLRRQLERVPGEWKAWFLETDSCDNTRSILKAWEDEEPRVNLLENDSGIDVADHDMHLRTHRLAVYRNALKDAWENDARPGDLVVVLDTDDVVGDIPGFLAACDKYSESWDALFPRTTYALWALRIKGATWNLWELTALATLGKVDGGMVTLLRKKLGQAASRAPLRVLSAFNGIGVYKCDTFRKGFYSGRNLTHSGVSHEWKARLPACHCGRRGCRSCYTYQRFHEECEHVNLHHSFGPSAVLYMLPYEYC